MRKIINKLFLFTLLGVLTLLFVNCEYEEDSPKIEKKAAFKQNLKVSKVHFKDFKNNAKLLNQLTKIGNKSNALTSNRILLSNDNSFYIDTDFAYYIEDEKGGHSYTFQINRKNPNLLLENLILNQNDSTGYDLYIAQYAITEQEYQELEQGHNPDLSEKITITPVDGTLIDINSLLSRGDVGGMCLTTTIIPGNTCPGAEHHNLEDILGGAYCPYFENGSFTVYAEQVIYSYSPCGEDQDGGGSSDSSGDNGSGYNEGTGGDANNDNSSTNDPNPNDDIEDTQSPVNTTPVLQADITEPCETLKQLIDADNDFETKIETLKNKINEGVDKEWIFSFERVRSYDPASGASYSYNTTPVEEGETTTTTAWQGGDYIGNIHLHPFFGHKIFSWQDIRVLLDTYEKAHRGNKRHVVVMIICENPNNSAQPLIFALKVNDIAKLQAKMEADWNDPKLAYITNDELRLKKIHEKLAEKYDVNKTSLEKYFLQKFGDYGIDLYQAQNGDLNNWNKLNLANNSDGVPTATPQPCNN
ncbi:hypothetical protein [Flavobacterium sp. HNIBRBA15423]|uniref:hypothetical protein n=1 Tax=Flavobacterium sp. HNIBRBA15423 TaxID=3458683 RepID=UPI0040450BC3